MLALVMFGVGSLIGTSMIGYITDNKSSEVGVAVNVMFMMLMVASSLWFLEKDEYNGMAFVMSLSWGL
jgi:predicted MFS family arabinose efflux permease